MPHIHNISMRSLPGLWAGILHLFLGDAFKEDHSDLAHGELLLQCKSRMLSLHVAAQDPAAIVRKMAPEEYGRHSL